VRRSVRYPTIRGANVLPSLRRGKSPVGRSARLDSGRQSAAKYAEKPGGERDGESEKRERCQERLAGRIRGLHRVIKRADDGDTRTHTIAVLRQQIEARTDPVIEALLHEVTTYPAPDGVAPAASDGPQRYATPLQIATRLGTVSFLSTTTIFGTPTDVTLAELALEMLFPADELTAAIVRSMTGEITKQRPGNLHLPKAG
jgi:MmyB-like transcription regulator ligand binding domain